MKKWLLMGIASSALLNGENATTSAFTFGIDYLYWETQQDDLDYGSITTSEITSISDDLSGLSINPTLIEASHAKIIRPHFNYESGFRANVGYLSPCAEFICNIIYTYLPNHVKTDTLPLSGEIISSVFTALPLSNIETKWCSCFNQLDIDFGSKINLGCSLELTPHIGVRGININQHFNVYATEIVTDTLGTDTTFNKLKQNFYGIGVEGGFWANINLGYGVSLIGHCGGALLYSKFKVKNEYETAIVINEVSTPIDLNYYKDSIRATTPVFDYYIGLNYTTSFCDTNFNLHLGWEQHVYFDVNRMQVGGDEYGNFSTSGLSVGIDFLF